MKSGDHRSVHSELGRVMSTLADILRNIDHLRELHTAEVSAAIADISAQNRQLTDTCKQLRAELGKRPPTVPPPQALPHTIMQDFARSSDPSTEDILEQPNAEPGFASANLRSGGLAKGEDEQLLKVPLACAIQPSLLSPRDHGQSSPRDRGQSRPQDQTTEPVARQAPDISGYQLSGTNEKSDDPLPIISRRPSRTKVATLSEDLVLRSAWVAVPPHVIETCAARYNFKIVDHRLASMRSTRSWGDFMDRVGRRSQRLSCNPLSIAHPGGPFRICWNGMSLTFISYDVFIVPLQAFDIGDGAAFQALEWMAALFWTADVILWFRTGYYEGSKVEMRSDKIAIKYAKTWLFFDILIVGFEWVSRLASVVLSASVLRASRIARRIVRFVKLVRVWKLQGIWTGLQDHVNSNVLQLCSTVMMLCMGLLIAIHVVSCLWYALGKKQSDGWPTRDAYTGHKDTLFWYTASTRWVIAQFNGRTDMDETRTMSERLFTCVVGVMFGVLARAMMLGLITRLLLELSELVSEKTRRNRHVNEFLESHPVPAALNSTIKRYAREYSDATRQQASEDTVLAILPERVQAELLFEVRSPVVDLHPFFQGLISESKACSLTACKNVTCIHAVKLDTIFGQGDPCTRMIFNDKLPMVYYPLYNAKTIVDLTTLDAWDADASEPCTVNSSSRRQLSRRKCSFAGLGRANTTETILSPGEALTGCELKRDEWISEAALWVEWFNRGKLVPQEHGQIFAIDASDLAQSVKHHKDAYSMTAVYAKMFLGQLQAQSPLSDIAYFHIDFYEQTPYHLEVVVISAEGLPNVDGFLKGTSDPYCVCYATDQAGSRLKKMFSTKVIDDCLDPVWNHHGSVQVSERQSLHFKVYDSEMIPSNDRLLGEVRLENSSFLADGFEGDLPLLGGPSHSGCASLTVKVTVEDVQAPGFIN